MDPITLMTVSTMVSAGGSLAAGNAKDKETQYEAAQLDQNANAKTAQGTREAAEKLRKGRVAVSDAQAQMAAGGGLASDAGSVEQLAQIEQVAEYNALNALYSRNTEAAGLRDQAKGKRYSGKVAKKAGRAKALSTIISGGSKAYESFSKSRTDAYRTTGQTAGGSVWQR